MIQSRNEGSISGFFVGLKHDAQKRHIINTLHTGKHIRNTTIKIEI